MTCPRFIAMSLAAWLVTAPVRLSTLAAEPGGGATTATPAPRYCPQAAAEVIPAPVPEAENAGPLYLQALAVLEAEDVWDSTLSTLAAEVYTSVFSASGQRSFVAWVEGIQIPQENNRQPTVGEAYDEFARRLESPAVIRALNLVSQGSERRRCGFHVDYSQGAEAQLPHLSKLRTLGRFLGAVGGLAVERGDAESAWECVLWQLSLADCLRTEPLLISQLVRAAILQMGISGLQQAAVAMPPSPEVQSDLDRRLDSFDDPGPWVLALDGERLIFGEWLLRQPPAKIQEMLRDSQASELAAFTPEQIASGRLLCAQALLRLAELATRPYHEVGDQIDALPGAAELANPLAKALLPAVGSICRKAAEAQALTRVTRTGLRLQRQKAVQGSYPPSLAALALTDLPTTKRQDPFTGKALCYHLEGDGFVLYSVGPDGRDDHGRARGTDAKTAYDVVWRLEK